MTCALDRPVSFFAPIFPKSQGETKVLKLKNLRPQDYASYTCQVSVRNVCSIPDKAITFQLTNTTGKRGHEGSLQPSALHLLNSHYSSRRITQHSVQGLQHLDLISVVL